MIGAHEETPWRARLDNRPPRGHSVRAVPFQYRVAADDLLLSSCFRTQLF
jgi:hypothetical protein